MGQRGPATTTTGTTGTASPARRRTRWFPRILILTVVAVIVVGGLVGGPEALSRVRGTGTTRRTTRARAPVDVTVQVMSGDTAFQSRATPAPARRDRQQRAAFEERGQGGAPSSTSSGSTGLQGRLLPAARAHGRPAWPTRALTNPKKPRADDGGRSPRGKRAVDVIAIIAAKTKIPLKNFQQGPRESGAARPAVLRQTARWRATCSPPPTPSCRHETALRILQAMVQRFNQEAQHVQPGEPLLRRPASRPPADHRGVPGPGRRAGSVSDYPKIAEVIHNRLAQGHAPASSTARCSTGSAKYAGKRHVQADQHPGGPYNSYLNAGLPAGPISNPGDAAIQGVPAPGSGQLPVLPHQSRAASHSSRRPR